MGAAAVSRGTPAGVVTTGSISSTVELDYGRGTAHKTYRPPAWVRALYRIAFQAPFPYTSNHAALEAARQRRIITGLLTKYWFGRDAVSPVLDIHDEEDERHGFVTELVRGGEPKDKRRARRFLKELTAQFLAAGLPTWQVTPYNPRAAGNLIEAEDGSYRIIDLESNLVAPLVPISGVVGAIRQGNFPAFDDIDIDRLRTYLEERSDRLEEVLGGEGAQSLHQAVRAYAKSAGEWHRGEARLLTKSLQLVLRLVDVPTWYRSVRRMTDGGQAKAEQFLRAGIDVWADEGYVSASEAARLRQSLRTPEVAAALSHLGTHIAMSIPLRFPLGSVARSGWTLAMRVKAEWAGLRGKQDPRAARQIHTLLVAILGLVPGFGAGAYLAAKPLRSNRALTIIAADRLLRKLPLKLYARLHLVALTTWFGRPRTERGAARRPTVPEIVTGVRERVTELGHHRRLIAGVLGLNLAVLTFGGVLYFGFDSPMVFVEGGVMNTMDSAELVLAGVFGLLAFTSFWRGAAGRASAGESAGIFFWGLSGLAMLALAADDFFRVHEQMGDALGETLEVVPLFTNNVDDAITLAFGATGLGVLYVFRRELFSRRHSSVLLLAGVLTSGLMVATDVYARGWIQPLEFPAQVSAVGLLLLAYGMRYREVRAAAAERVQDLS